MDPRSLVLASLCCILAIFPANGQRLSQGASDWYMRFHSNDYVKRNVDRPQMKSFIVNSNVKQCYAVTEVTMVVYNPATIEQTFNFGYVLPKKALISNVTIQRGQFIPRENEKVASNTEAEVIVAALQDSELVERLNEEAPEEEVEAGDLNFMRLNQATFHQFVLPINLRANDHAVVTLVYEYLLDEVDGKYRHVTSLSPGEIVEDFQVHISIEDDRLVKSINITAPVIGVLMEEANRAPKQGPLKEVFILDREKQYNSFGKHGFNGDLITDIELDDSQNEMDVLMDDGFFVHTFNVPEDIAEQKIPTHVIFLIDLSSTMINQKLAMAKETLSTLLSSMKEGDFFNIVAFNDVAGNVPQDWPLPGDDEIMSAQAISEATIIEAIAFVNELDNDFNEVNRSTNYIDQAIVHAKKMSDQITLPDNVISRIVLLTDGGLFGAMPDENNADPVALNEQRGPSLILVGIGSELNAPFMEKVGTDSDNFVDKVVEDIPLTEQLDAVKQYMDDVILKDVRLRYFGKAGQELSVTNNYFRFLRRDSSVVVAGQLGPSDKLMDIEVSAQSADGNYQKTVPFPSGSEHYGCIAKITLCSKPMYKGKCRTFTGSEAKLKGVKFAKKAVSAKVAGDCLWRAYPKANFRGQPKVIAPGAYQVLPADLYKTISSLQIDGPSYAKMIWSYLTVQDVINGRVQETPQHAKLTYQVAKEQNFLTPFTNVLFDNNIDIVGKNVVTFEDLSPDFVQVDDPLADEQHEALMNCQEPFTCQDNFHMEYLSPNEEKESDCNGTLSLFTRSSFEGEMLTVEQSLNQLYHSANERKIRSFKSEGNCCWLLFNHPRLTGKVEKICGDDAQQAWRNNIGSVKKIGGDHGLEV